jgi:hypothetical protein
MATYGSPMRHARQPDRPSESHEEDDRPPEGTPSSPDEMLVSRTRCGVSRTVARRLLPLLVLLLLALVLSLVGGTLVKRARPQMLRMCEWMQQHAPPSAIYFGLGTFMSDN